MTAIMAASAILLSMWIGKDGNSRLFAAKRAVLADAIPLWIGMLILAQCIERLRREPCMQQLGPGNDH